MQQHLMQMQPMMATHTPTNITTDHIQQYLDENKSLILKILENQNSGKVSECAENQARLQRNLMYLAAIADCQPQPPSMQAQFAPAAAMHSGMHYMQQSQQMMPQSLMGNARSPILYGQHQPFSALQQQQALHSQMGMSSAGMHGESHAGGGGPGGFPEFGRGNTTWEGMQAATNSRGVASSCSRQDVGAASSAEGRGGNSGRQDSGEERN